MSEIEVRMALVGPTGPSLRNLNNKNNLANLYLRKQVALYEKEMTFNIAHMKDDASYAHDLLRHIHKREPATNEEKLLLDRDDDSRPGTAGRTMFKIRKRKIRLSKTAPANMKHSEKKAEPERRKSTTVATESDSKRNIYIKALGRKKSFVIQLSGDGKRYEHDDSEEEDDKVLKELPKPNANTLLDVMIGLSAFSHVPPPRCQATADEKNYSIRPDSRLSPQIESRLTPQQRRRKTSRTESRMTPQNDSRMTPQNDSRMTPQMESRLTPQDPLRRDSLYDSFEDLSSDRFMEQWRKKVASRRESIVQKLETGIKGHCDPLNTPPRCTSSALSSAPHDQLMNHQLRRKSIKPHSRSLMVPSLPAIHDEDEIRDTFFAWGKEDSDKTKAENDIETASQKSTDIKAKTRKRRESFAYWLQDRQIPKGAVKGGNRLPLRNRYEDIDEADEDEQNIGEMMRTLLMIKSKFKDPLSKRLSRFYSDIDRIKERDEAARRNLTGKERKRRWKLLIHGIDAALADSFDEDDYGYMHTV